LGAHFAPGNSQLNAPHLRVCALNSRNTSCVGILAIVAALATPTAACGGDLGIVPLFDGERSDSRNLWGGPISSGNTLGVVRQSSVVHSGAAAYRADLGSIAADGSRFFQAFSSAVTGAQAYRQDRDLAPYAALEGYVRNDAGGPITLTLELKDYRDSLSHRALRSYTIPAGGWTKVEAPLDLAAGWTVAGAPDLSRTYALGFLVDADFGPASGPVYLDDFSLIEHGPAIDPAMAPLEQIVERLARRQFTALWASRNKTSGLIPNTSDNVQLGALNTTAGVVWALPTAIRRGWVAQPDAHSYMGQLVSSLDANRNQSTYLPTRFLDLATAAPATNREESTIDAAFIALALHSYKSQEDVPQPLRDSIDALTNRFEWTAFDGPEAYRLAYVPGTGFSPYTYSGYTNENKVIALAGELSTDHHVPLETMWNKDVGRSLAHLVDPTQNFLVYSYGTDYRAPFAQALLNLFVDASDRGVDSFPNRALARNPWINFVRYEGEAAARLEQLGREHFFQPDAGLGAAGYQPYNLFNSFGQPNQFMPWSASLALLAGAPGADEALRYLVDNGLTGGLDGPFGLADSALWATGASGPSAVPSFADNWNVTLSTLALLEYLDRAQGVDGASRRFADLTDVRAALDRVFIEGDLDGDGAVDGDDLARWRQGFGKTVSATPLMGDADGDGDVDGADFLRWQRGLRSAALDATTGNVPEPSGLAILAVASALLCRGGGRQ
jgi:hypothetical protein